MASDTAIEIRPLAARSEYEECVALQRKVWGAGYSEIVPVTVIEIAVRVGGICIGAFRESGELVGFVFGVTGPRGGALTHWSHMLAVKEGWRGRGLGARMKFAQQEAAATLGAKSIQWTFDPLVSRNAHFNLNRLGVSVVRYAPDMYGPSGSELHRLGTDRLVVRWELAEGGDAPTAPAGDSAEVAIPSDIDALRRRDLDEALAWRAANRRDLGGLLGDGYQVVGFERGADFGRYLLVRAAVPDPSGRAGG